MDMQNALQSVGFQPTPHVRLRTLRRKAEREAKADGVIESPIKHRKIQVTKAGSHYRARYAGSSCCCFGETPEEASKKLRGLPRSASEKMKYLGGGL